MTKADSEELKPCPFCGAPVELAAFTAEEDGARLYGIVCESCGLYADFSERTTSAAEARRETVAAWNRRI